MPGVRYDIKNGGHVISNDFFGQIQLPLFTFVIGFCFKGLSWLYDMCYILVRFFLWLTCLTNFCEYFCVVVVSLWSKGFHCSFNLVRFQALTMSGVIFFILIGKYLNEKKISFYMYVFYITSLQYIITWILTSKHFHRISKLNRPNRRLFLETRQII